jgi:hypothetical protein
MLKLHDWYFEEEVGKKFVSSYSVCLQLSMISITSLEN